LRHLEKPEEQGASTVVLASQFFCVNCLFNSHYS